ncbi:hypothetical protein Tco_0807283 [Tanacetum coccineum]
MTPHPNSYRSATVRYGGCDRLVSALSGKRVAKAIEEYEKTRANLDNAGSLGGNFENARGTVNVQGCSHKTFMNGKPHPFNGTEGVVGLRRWIDKVEQVFEICKCAEEDKVMFVAGSGYQQKDRKPSQNDKTEHGMEKTVQNQGQSPKMPKSESIQKNQQSNRSRN